MKKTLKILCLASSLVFVAGCSVNESIAGFFGLGSKDVIPELQDQYDLYDTVRIPTHTFTTEKGSVTVNGVVVMPDGSASNNETIQIKQVGQYEVRYSGKIAGEDVNLTKTFLVKKPLIQYTNSTGTSISYSVPLYAKPYTSAEGVYVSLAKGDTLRINQAIDFTSTKSYDKVISCFATPYIQGQFDFAAFNFVLRDSENPNIYLTVLCNSQAQLPKFPEYVYFRAGGQNQTLTGKYTNPNTGAIQYQTKGLIGTLAKISMHAAHNNGKETPVGIDPSTEPVYFAYDSEDVAIYTPCKEEAKYPGASKCADLDNTEYFKSNLWNGFPSKKAYLEITGARFNGPAARFCITSILGVDLTQKYIEDTTAPEIDVDFPQDTMPEGKLNTEYRIPSATAHDSEDNEDKKVSTKVFYNYGTSSQVSVRVVDNKFVPTREGTYVIEYTAKDLYGNVGYKTLPVHVGDKITDIDFKMPSIPSSCLAGESFDLGEATNPTGGVGIYTTKITVTDSLGTQEISLGRYTPRVLGNTVIKYTVYDYVGNNTTKSVTVDVKTNSSPVFLRYENLDDNYLTEFDNLIPSCVVNVTEGDRIVERLCDLTVTDVRGTREYQYTTSSETFNVYGDNTQTTAKLTFKSGGVVVDTKTVGLVEPKIKNKLALQNYFIGSGFTTEQYSSGSIAGIRVKSTDSTSSWKFFNKLTGRNAKLIMNKKNGASTFGFTKAEVKLTDSVDPSISLTLTIFNDYFLISKDTVHYSINIVKDSTINVAMNTSKVSVNGVSFDIKYYDNGEAFNGFPSELVYTSVTTYGNDADYVVRVINNQLLYKTSDTTMPDYCLTGDYGGSYAQGSLYVVNRMVYADVVKPYTKAFLTVMSGNKYVTALDGTMLNKAPVDTDYTIQLNDIGMYSFIYTFLNETEDFRYTAYALDNNAPTINITSQVPTTINYGGTITVPSFEVVDDTSVKEEITVIVSIVIPTGYEKLMMYTLPNDVTGAQEMVTVATSITAIYRGTYKLKITAVDSSSNSSLKMIDILVK